LNEAIIDFLEIYFANFEACKLICGAENSVFELPRNMTVDI